MQLTTSYQKLKKFTVLYSLLLVITHTGHCLDLNQELRKELSLEQEALLGQSAIAYMERNGAIFEDLVSELLLQNFGNKVINNYKINDFKPKFMFLKNDAINACAFMGGNIAINTGLINFLNDQNELAGIIAHELAHISQRHLLRQLISYKELFPALIVGSIATAAVGVPALVVPIMAAGVQQQINFTREFEKEADQIGMKILANSQFSVHGLPAVFKRLNQAHKFDVKYFEYLSTHPIYAQRLSFTKTEADSYPYSQSNISQANFLLMKARVKILTSHKLENLILELKHNLQQKLYVSLELCHYELSFALLKYNNYKEAIYHINQAILLDPNNIVYQYTLAEIEAHTNPHAALDKLKNLLLLDENAIFIHELIAKILIELKRPDTALAHLETCLTKDHFRSKTYSLMSIAYSMKQNTNEVHYINSKIAAIRLDFQLAKSEINMALENANTLDRNKYLKFKQEISQIEKQF